MGPSWALLPDESGGGSFSSTKITWLSVVPMFSPLCSCAETQTRPAPGAKATRERGGSGFISPDNNDGSAENMWRLLREARVDRRREVVTWNVVPWYIGSDKKIRAAESPDLLEGRRYIEELLGLLTSLRVVVLIGKAAVREWSQPALDVPTIEAPHPSFETSIRARTIGL